MTKFCLVQSVEGKLTSSVFTEANVIPAMSARGFEINPDRVGGHHLRPELRGQPCFKGLCGPMWGGEDSGEPIVRYEDSEANDILSR